MELVIWHVASFQNINVCWRVEVFFFAHHRRPNVGFFQSHLAAVRAESHGVFGVKTEEWVDCNHDPLFADAEKIKVFVHCRHGAQIVEIAVCVGLAFAMLYAPCQISDFGYVIPMLLWGFSIVILSEKREFVNG